ncbi:MAG: hypothetical protein EBT03_09370 [Betaproteobacteria bacterium]|nr:hypothetical protein [Betaproteobacteria bacterium]NCA17239.1 hypothetical protein [Betaproteobacteria bacterium]
MAIKMTVGQLRRLVESVVQEMVEPGEVVYATYDGVEYEGVCDPLYDAVTKIDPEPPPEDEEAVEAAILRARARGTRGGMSHSLYDPRYK